METLGLASPREREDNFFQRLFWPSVRNQYDVDLIGRRGFWLAFAVGLISAVALLVQGQLIASLITLVVFSLGAAGIRERSVAASVLVFTLYFLGIVVQWIAAALRLLHTGNPLLSLLCIALLLSSVRATLLSRQFADEGDQEFPSAVDAGLIDTLVNRFPHAVWPKAKIPFVVLASLYLLFSVVGSSMLLAKGLSARHALQATPKSMNVNER